MSSVPARPEPSRTGSWPPPAHPTTTTARCRELATAIHDRALQSIAVCLLQTELAQRMWDRGEPTRALEELQSIAPELEAAAEALREIMTELVALASSPARSA